VPLLRYFFSDETVETMENEVLIVLTPRVVRLPEITAANLRSLDVGTDTNVKLRLAMDRIRAEPPGQPPAGETKPTPPTAAPAPQGGMAIRFDPNLVNVPIGQTFVVNVVVENVKDLFSLPFLVQFDSKVIQIDDVRHGGFMSSDGQAVAIVQRIDPENGVAIISLTRPPGTSGTSGSGAVVTLVARSLSAGRTALRIPQVNARTATQQPILLSTGECIVVVQ
jgi:general secretion pathway protein D